MHNLRGYESHLITKKAFKINEKIGNRKIDGIPNNNEQVLCFSIGDMRIIDSMQLMQSSLETLVHNLYDKIRQVHALHAHEEAISKAYRTVMPEEYIPL